MIRTGIASLLLAVLVLPHPAGAQTKPEENPVITEFKKYIRSPEPEVRRDQVERLARVQTSESVDLLLRYGLTDKDNLVRERAVAALATMEGDARSRVLAGLEGGKPQVREGVALALGAMKDWGRPPCAELGAVLIKDRSEDVQAAAAEALGMLGAKDGVPFLLEALSGRDEKVVIAAADALAMVKCPEAGTALLAALDHVSWRVQVAALHALSEVRVKESVGPLIDYLDNAVGRPRQDARRALVKITQRTFGMGAEDWRGWWDSVKDTWTVPPEAKEKDEEQGHDPGRGYARKPTRYHRIETYSKRIIFVIDVSTSMETPILLKAGKRSGDTDRRYGGTPKLAIAREELAFALRGMDPETRFNVIAFETDVRTFKKDAVPANPGNVQAAIRWIEKQKARKPSGRFSSGPGVDKNGWTMGRTNTYGALAAVFGLRVDPKTGTGGTTSPGPGTKRRPRWDTCFFLSDGRPTEGVVTGVNEILQEVRRWNKTCKMVIHCIGMEEDQGLVALLQGLAQITGGKCVFVGK